MPSLSARTIAAIIRLRRSKKAFSSAGAILAEVAALQIRPESCAPPKKLDKTVGFSVRTVKCWPVYTVTPRGAATRRRALYSHGGSWFHEIKPIHWDLIAKLAAATRTQFTVPIFPPVPAGTAATVIPAIADMAAELVAEVGADCVTIMGDSAGGTITLAVAMQLRDRGLPAPHGTLLISPALDLAFTDPAIARIAPSDPWLAAAGLRAAAQLWRGELPLDDPLVSPIHGDLTGLAPITLFSGTHDIINADARSLVRKARAADFPLDYHEAPGMLHVYPLLPVPEANAARAVMEKALRG
jgi:acetyl esterase/lipase